MTTPIVRRVADLRPLVAAWKRAGHRVALVPTMGALHAGHLALVRRACNEGDRVVVSIFVNPRQFDRPDDLTKYPRSEAADAALLGALAVDTIFAPGTAEVYPDGHATTVSVRGVGEGLEGAHRPGHFDGVATVVAKLFGMVQPDAACFGEKDWQQLQVVRRLVADLDIPVRVVGCPTVRDADGLALSSRNLRLSPADRVRAAALPRALHAVVSDLGRGLALPEAFDRARATLIDGGFDSIDYLACRDAATLGDPIADRPARLLAAAWIGRVRLIDNAPVMWSGA